MPKSPTKAKPVSQEKPVSSEKPAKTKLQTKLEVAPAAWETRTTSLSELVFDPEYQSRAEPVASDEFAEVLRDSGGQWVFPPVTVCEVRKRLLVVDGFTRGRAAASYCQEAGLDPVSFELPIRYRVCTVREAFDECLGANADHGYRRTNADKHSAVLRAIGRYPKYSAEKIAALVKVSHTYVYKLKAKLAKPDQAEPSPEEVSQAGEAHEAGALSEEQAEAEKVKRLTAERAEEARVAQEHRALMDRMGACPVCQAKDWEACDDGYNCGTCLHPYGEPAGLSGDEGDEKASPVNPAQLSAQDQPQAGPSTSGTSNSAAGPMLDLRAQQIAKARTAHGALVRLCDSLGLSSETEAPLQAILTILSRTK